MRFLKIGERDRDGRQKRIEHTGRYLRASRTGGVSLRASARVSRITATLNSRHGVRLSTGIAPYTQIAMQNGRTILRGRYGRDELRFNVSKSGVTASTKTGIGTLNWIKPRRSSAKLFGVQIRGRNAVLLNALHLISQTVAQPTADQKRGPGASIDDGEAGTTRRTRAKTRRDTRQPDNQPLGLRRPGLQQPRQPQPSDFGHRADLAERDRRATTPARCRGREPNGFWQALWHRIRCGWPFAARPRPGAEPPPFDLAERLADGRQRLTTSAYANADARTLLAALSFAVLALGRGHTRLPSNGAATMWPAIATETPAVTPQPAAALTALCDEIEGTCAQWRIWLEQDSTTLDSAESMAANPSSASTSAPTSADATSTRFAVVDPETHQAATTHPESESSGIPGLTISEPIAARIAGLTAALAERLAARLPDSMVAETLLALDDAALASGPRTTLQERLLDLLAQTMQLDVTFNRSD